MEQAPIDVVSNFSTQMIDILKGPVAKRQGFGVTANALYEASMFDLVRSPFGNLEPVAIYVQPNNSMPKLLGEVISLQSIAASYVENALTRGRIEILVDMPEPVVSVHSQSPSCRIRENRLPAVRQSPPHPDAPTTPLYHSPDLGGNHASLRKSLHQSLLLLLPHGDE